uniref:Uncharacterized protein n=1 Tax=Knipowitschia caucasica TaxID=637954 RepID=A0AAV2JPL5_KNICA
MESYTGADGGEQLLQCVGGRRGSQEVRVHSADGGESTQVADGGRVYTGADGGDEYTGADGGELLHRCRRREKYTGLHAGRREVSGGESPTGAWSVREYHVQIGGREYTVQRGECKQVQTGERVPTGADGGDVYTVQKVGERVVRRRESKVQDGGM